MAGKAGAFSTPGLARQYAVTQANSQTETLQTNGTTRRRSLYFAVRRCTAASSTRPAIRYRRRSNRNRRSCGDSGRPVGSNWRISTRARAIPPAATG